MNTDIPDFLRLTKEEREAGWRLRPPRAMPAAVFDKKPRDEDAVTAAFRAEMEAKQKARTRQRISDMLAKKNKSKLDITGLRWSSRHNKFIPDVAYATSSQEKEEDMANKITFQAFDANGELLERGCTSIQDPATDVQIAEKVDYVFNRAKTAVNVSVTKVGGEPYGAWVREVGAAEAARKDDDYRSAPMPKKIKSADAAVAPAEPEENEVAKKTKTKTKMKKPTKAKAKDGPKKRTRVDITLEALKQWVSASELAAKFKAELGDGKLSTAKLALHKVPKNVKRKIETKKDEDRGTLYRFA